ncbi:unnamed protein product, partial [Gulo gulo]
MEVLECPIATWPRSALLLDFSRPSGEPHPRAFQESEVVLPHSEGLRAPGTSIWVSVARSCCVIKSPKKAREPSPCGGEDWGCLSNEAHPKERRRQELENGSIHIHPPRNGAL